MDQFDPHRKVRDRLPQEVLRKKELLSVESLKEPIKKIVKELQEDFEDGAYSVIIGEDASGRIPARILGRIAAEFSRRGGNNPPLMRYIAGSTRLWPRGRLNKTRLVADQLRKVRETLVKEGREPAKVLVVTEAMASGLSMKVILDGLHEIGWDGDIATVGIESESPKSRASHYEESMHTKVVFGMRGTPEIYTKGKKLSGVRKKSRDLFAKPDKRTFFHSPAPVEKQRAARDVADDVAYQILDELSHDSGVQEEHPNEFRSVI